VCRLIGRRCQFRPLDYCQTLLALDDIAPEACFIVYGVWKNDIALPFFDIPQPLFSFS